MKKILSLTLLMFLFLAFFSRTSEGRTQSNDMLDAYTLTDYLYNDDVHTIQDYTLTYQIACYDALSLETGKYLGKPCNFLPVHANYFDLLWCSNVEYEGEDYIDNNNLHTASIYKICGDDPIVNIIPKEYFLTEGSLAYSGNEYGFYINTIRDNCGSYYPNIMNNEYEIYISQVFLYDIYLFEETRGKNYFKFYPLFSAEFVSIKANQSFLGYGMQFFYTNLYDWVVMPSLFRIPENTTGRLNLTLSNPLLSVSYAPSGRQQTEIDEITPFISAVYVTLNVVDEAIYKPNEIDIGMMIDLFSASFGIVNGTVNLIQGNLLSAIKVVASANTFIKTVEEMVDALDSPSMEYEQNYNSLKVQYPPDYLDQVETFGSPIRNALISLPLEDVNGDYRTKNAIKAQATITPTGEIYKYDLNNCIDYLVVSSVANSTVARESYNIKHAFSFQLIDENNNILPQDEIKNYNSNNCNFKKTAYDSEDSVMVSCYEDMCTNYTVKFNDSGTYNIAFDNNNVEIMAVYYILDGKIFSCGYYDSNILSLFALANMEYIIRIRGVNNNNILMSIEIDKSYPYTLSIDIEGRTSFTFTPISSGFYYFYTIGSYVDTQISVYENGNLLEYNDDTNINDDIVDYNGCIGINLLANHIYEVVVDANNWATYTTYCEKLYVLSNTVTSNISFTCSSGNTYTYYYTSGSSESLYLNAYTMGSVDTKISIYVGSTLVAQNDDTNIDSDIIEYNANCMLYIDKWTTYKIEIYTYSDGITTLYVNEI